MSALLPPFTSGLNIAPMKKPMPKVEMNRDLPEGEYVAFAEDPSKHERRRIPGDPIPAWAVTVHVSPEDYGKIMLFLSGERP